MIKIEKILNENRKGKITFDSISISSITKFPNIEVKLYDLKMVDSLFQDHKRETIFLQEVSTSVSIIDAFKEELKITAVSAEKGHINIFVDEDHYTNTYVFEANSKKKAKNLNLKVIENDVAILIEDIEFSFIEKIKNKRITAHLNKLDFNIDISGNKIDKVNLDVLMKEMGLNLEKGIFFNNARCVGSFHLVFDTKLHTIEIPKFDLNIEEQLFNVTAQVNTETKNFTFLLGIKDLHYEPTTRLLAANIKSRLEGFEIVKPFEAKAKISGKFEYQNLTYVELQFNTKDNEIIYKKDSLHINNVSFNGSFINRFHLDKPRIEERKNYTLSFENFSGNFNEIPFQLSEVSVKSDFPKPLKLATKFEVEGDIKSINDIVNSKDYKLSRGTFNVNGSYAGKINSLNEVLKASEINLKIKKLIIQSKNNKTRFNVPFVDLEIANNNANIKNLTVRFGKHEKIKVNGFVQNFGSLLTNNKNNLPTISNVNFTSNYLDFNSILKSFGSHKKQTESKNLSEVKKSFNILAKKFNPTITFSIKKLDFFAIPFANVNLDLQYQKNSINIKNISGNYKNGGANAKIKIGLNPLKNNQDKEAVKLDLTLNVFGKIEHWAEMLHNKNFFFNDADYTMEMRFLNTASTLTDLIDESNILLNIKEGSMFYKPVNLTLPFNKISVNIKNRNAYLNDFELKLPDNQSLHLKGEVTNFIEIFDDSITTYHINSSITLFSKNINFSNFIDTFNPNPQKSKKQNNLKVILNDLHTKFNPSLKLDFEKLSYNNVTLEDVNASLLFEDKNTLQIKNTYCYFYNKKLTLDAEIDISNLTQTRFKTNFNLDDFAIEQLLSTFENFGYKKLDKPTEIHGIINLNADFSGEIDDNEGVNYDSLKADVKFDIEQLNVNDFQPIVDAGNKVFRKQRFEEIKFANIKSNLLLKDNIITIPSTNVQSTAFDFFIEGKLDNTSHTDLWISIPLSNLKRRDLTEAPNRKNFLESGKKNIPRN